MLGGPHWRLPLPLRPRCMLLMVTCPACKNELRRAERRLAATQRELERVQHEVKSVLHSAETKTTVGRSGANIFNTRLRELELASANSGSLLCRESLTSHAG